ncbi:MAG: hypothetical protein LBQ66_04415 [Planctomycetaceae bacterium]|nr:hypothetical protein [Planctomycetaceae bacterium]
MCGIIRRDIRVPVPRRFAAYNEGLPPTRWCGNRVNIPNRSRRRSRQLPRSGNFFVDCN